MKRTIILLLTLAALLAVPFVASSGSGTRLMYDQKTLLSAETGTATGDAKDLNAGYKDFTVDVVTLGTGTVVVRTDCNANNDGVFDTTGLGTAITCGWGETKCTEVYNGQPMIQCRAVITSATGTNSTSVYLLGVQ